MFSRAGADLTCAVKVTLKEAMCGFNRIVLKHLDGRGIQIEHKRGTMLTQGQILKLDGEGMPLKRGEDKGDLYLVVEIEWPSDEWLSDEKNITQLQQLLPSGPVPTFSDLEHVDEVKFTKADPEEVNFPSTIPKLLMH